LNVKQILADNFDQVAEIKLMASKFIKLKKNMLLEFSSPSSSAGGGE
jgi:hypothetical protein